MAKPKRPLADRLWERVTEDLTTGCWNWTGPTSDGGYGVIGRGGRHAGLLRTHRAAYKLMVGEIPEGLHLDHLCKNRVCCNPAHLEPVTQAENNRRAFADYHQCPQGHELPPKTPPGVKRKQCSTCASDQARATYQARKQAVA